MRTASIRDLHIRTSELVRDAESGDAIIIERRGQPVAELRPITEKPTISREAKERIFARMKKVRESLPMGADSTLWIEEDRNR